jgi:hypothetical protein
MRNAEEQAGPRGSGNEETAKGADYRSPHHVELRYDGLLSTRPGISDPEALRLLALPNPLLAQHHARSARSRKRAIVLLVWLALSLVGLFVWNGMREASGDAPVDGLAQRVESEAQPARRLRPAMPHPAERAPLSVTNDITDMRPAAGAGDAGAVPPIGLVSDTGISVPPAGDAHAGAAAGRKEGALREISSVPARAVRRETRGCDDAISALGLCQPEPRGAASALGMLPRKTERLP